MLFQAGTRFGAYEVINLIGSGGMGEVWLATELRLGRKVALKLLPADFTRDSVRIQRFEQEARAASALNHPNVCTIYALDQTIDRQHYIAMEYVEGETLRTRLAASRLSLREALDIAIQVAAALSVAHAAGIVHRDIKPENVMLRPDGVVKVLDFGLAKLAAAVPDGADTTRMDINTDAGTVVGTAAYMSPEQARGQQVDTRTDIWSLGVMLYEMVAGRSPFAGPSGSDVLAAILQKEPAPVARFDPEAPAEVQRILTKTLRKDRSQRYQTVRDLLLDLQALRDDLQSHARAGSAPVTAIATEPAASGSGQTVVGPPRRRHVWFAVAALVFGLGTVLGVWTWRTARRAQTPAPPTTAAVQRASPVATVLTPLTADSGLSCDPALSPDGKLLAYASDRSGDGNLDLWVQQVGGGEPVRLTRHAADDYEPSFSPDGTLIAFSSQRQGGGIYVIPALSGEERLIAAGGRRPRFSPDGTWLAYWDTGKTYVVPARGGHPRQIAPEFLVAATPVWSPDGKRLMFVGNRDAPGSIVDDWYIAALAGGPVKGTGAMEFLRRHGLTAPYNWFTPDVWLPGDDVLFSATSGASANLWQVRVSSATGQLHDAPRQLTSMASGAGLGLQASAALSGDSLRVAFWNVTANVDVWTLMVDSNRGKPLGQMSRLTRNAAIEQWASLSADGRKMAYNVRGQDSWDVWLMDLESGRQMPLAVGPSSELFPKITRDGSRVAYAVQDGKTQTISILSLGAAVPEKVCDDCTEPWDWSSDGRHLLYREGLPRKIGVLGSTGGKKIVLERQKYSLNSPHFSPDDRWIFFAAEPGLFGASTLYIAPFEGERNVPVDEWRVITVSSTFHSPAGWSADGNLLYFMSERDGFRCLWAQRLHPTSRQALGAPFEVQPFHRAQVRSPGMWQPGAAGIAMARDRISFSMVEAAGNIWMAQVK